MVFPRSLKPLQGLNQTKVIGGVKPNCRLVTDIKHTHKPTANLGGQPNALCLTTGKGSRGTVKGEIIQANIPEEAKAGTESP